jgi:isopenicillin-N N-acyltransferase-like protein
MQFKAIKKWFFILATITLVVFIGLKCFLWWVEATPPDVGDKSALQWTRKTINDSTFVVKNNFLRKNQFGIWEMYLEGSPFERGVAGGMLSKELLDYQEFGFASGINEKVPGGFYQYLLKLFIAWFNKDLPDYVPLEYQQEIYGYSLFASDDYDYIGPKYHRKLNYHAAHDIGHALQNMGLVAGCTAIAAWNEESADSNLIIGRNFDFYVGDAFAKTKIILFMRPDKGIPFGMVTWPGFMGAVSGMNQEGITVTLNAAPNRIPESIKMPVALLGREILQYASNLEEAKQIAQKHPTFVSELFLIGSSKANDVLLIEKTPDTTLFFKKENHLVVSNHFQSPFLSNSESNLDARKNTSTSHRFARMEELFLKNKPLNPQILPKVLRNTKGIGESELGLGCEMAVNQMTAHHAIILKPHDLQFWVACHPSQVGPFISYRLDSVFKKADLQPGPLNIPQTTLPADSIIFTEAYSDFLKYRKLANTLLSNSKDKTALNTSEIDNMVQLNPELHQAYALAGEYYLQKGNKEKAAALFKTGLQKAIPWTRDSIRLAEGLNTATKK